MPRSPGSTWVADYELGQRRYGSRSTDLQNRPMKADISIIRSKIVMPTKKLLISSTPYGSRIVRSKRRVRWANVTQPQVRACLKDSAEEGLPLTIETRVVEVEAEVAVQFAG